MIEKVIKRDGSIEPFDVDKLNHWAIWASENCDVSWTDIVFSAVGKVGEVTTSVDLQNALIKTCIEHRTEEHTKVAARLTLGNIYKEAYDDFSIPHLPEFYHQMVDDGFWADMGYSDEELEHLDGVIDHTHDFSYSFATLRQFIDKYAMKRNGQLLESPQMLFMGLAMSNMRDEPNRLQEIELAYEKLKNLKINLPTPTLSLERTETLPAPSCCVISGNDTVPSIGAATHVAYDMTAKSAGIGVELRTRAPKDPVKNGRIQHGGKYSYYSYIDRAVKGNRQVVRGGSATVTFNVLDPEIMDLVTMRSQRTDPTYRLDQMDYSMACNNLFIKKALTGQNWMSVSPYFAPKLWELSYSGDEEAFEEEYNRVFNSTVKKVIIPAADILKAWARPRFDHGRIYITFLDNMNSHTPFKDVIRLSNLCVTGDQLVVSDRGLKTVRELVDEGGELTLFDGEKPVKAEPMQLIEKDAEVFRITLENGLTHDVTGYHKVKTERGMVACEDLEVGQSVCFQNQEGLFGTKHEPVLAFGQGMAFDTEYLQELRLCTKETQHAYFSGLIEGQPKQVELKYRKVLKRYHGDIYHGEIYHDDPTVLGELQQILLNLGSSSIAYEGHLRLGNCGNIKVGRVRIKSIEPIGKQDVYCTKVHSDEHVWVCNGIITSNCQEIAIPTEGFDGVESLYLQPDEASGEVGLCNLAAIVISNIKDEEDYIETAYVAAKIVDNCIERGVYPFPHIEATAKARRSIGIGITDLAHHLARKGLKYSTEEGKNEMHRIAELHSFALHKASVRLAKERGKCEWFHKTKYSDEKPWLPIDTYKKKVDTLHSQHLLCDWEGLREDIKKYGVRFSVLEAFMPTESSSVFTNSTNGLYPVRKLDIYKSSHKGMVYFRAPGIGEYEYENAYELDWEHMVALYSIFQKFTGQSISADFYTIVDGVDHVVKMSDVFKRVAMAMSCGMKTFYYENFETEVPPMIGGEEEKAGEEGCEECKM